MLLPSLNATTIAPMQSPPTFTNWAGWNAYITTASPPQAGCFVATYPNPVWQPTQCGTPPSQPMVVGSGNDWVAEAPSGKLINSVLGGFINVNGLTSETDVCVGPAPYCTSGGKGANYYSLQINANSGFPVTYYGKKTTGWEQFIYQNNGFSGSCGTSSCGMAWIEYWLNNYWSTYGSCPPASQNPPGGGTSNWFTSVENPKPGQKGVSCVYNTNGPVTPYEPPTNLLNLILYAYSNSKVIDHSWDQVTLCVTGGDCYLKSLTDTVLRLYKYWTQSEFNVFGYTDGSRAEFNSGTTIGVLNDLENHDGAPFTKQPTCLKGGSTGETNNLNLGSCSPNVSSPRQPSWITFTESSSS